MLPQLANGHQVHGRVARPRLTSLPLPGQPPVKILEAAPERIGLVFYNDGTGTVYLSDDPAEQDANLMFPIPPGATLTPGITPVVPQNALFAAGDAGHSLRIWELITMRETIAPAPAPPPRRKSWSLLRAVLLAAQVLMLADPALAQIMIPPSGGGGGGNVNLQSLGGTALSGADVVDVANTALRIRCVLGCGAGGGTVDQGAPALVGNAWPFKLTDGVDTASVTAAGRLEVDGSGVTQPVSGTVTANAGSGTFTIAGTVTANAGTGTFAVSLPNEDQQTRANSISVVLASNQIVCSSRVAISQTADTQVITGAASSFIYICGIALVAGGAETINIIEGTGTTCATSPAALYGSTTEANGLALAANGGFTQAAAAPFIRTQTANTNLCITQVGTARIAGSISYVVAP